jgi:hypothetical protein
MRDEGKIAAARLTLLPHLATPELRRAVVDTAPFVVYSGCAGERETAFCFRNPLNEPDDKNR